jgi:hypothetical protein
MIMARSDVFRRLIRAVWPKVMPTGRELTMIMACALHCAEGQERQHKRAED